MMRIANNLREAPAVIGIAMLSIFLGAAGCAKEDNSNKPLPVKVSWPAVAPSALHAKFLHSNGYGGATIELNPDQTFEFTLGECTYYQKCLGGFTLDSGVIVLESDGRYPSLFSKLHDRNIVAVEWRTRRVVPIEWGERLYLVDEDKVVEFCNNVNAGYEPRSELVGWPYFLRDGDWQKPANGKPKLPKKYSEYLADGSFEAKVVKQNEYVLELDKGFEDGVRVGMQMWAEFEDKQKHTTVMEIVTVGPKSAVAEVRGGRWPMAGETVSLCPKSPKD
ncbi:MAG: hypothetical protein R3E58_00065 [Phycisphaerae bacterium]|nr:hypothetical protein [Phycisphaerales bacterium]